MTKSRHRPRIEFEIRQDLLEHVRGLPWDLPIERWRKKGVRHLDIKRGAGRHPLIFVETMGFQLAIKELGADVARREIDNYRRMKALGISTLDPVGTVVRHGLPIRIETPAGPSYEPNQMGHSVTLVADRVLPDSQLYRRDFQRKNRRRILDAIIELFVSFHTNGVFWGDASLANTLVMFLKEDVPHLGSRTILKAYLADAETVEIHSSLSDEKRGQDVEFFLESMQWIEEDLRRAGIDRDERAGAEDAEYVLEQYALLYETAVRQRSFEEETGLSLTSLLGRVTRPEYVESLRRHIDEHKWYRSEELKRGVSTKEAATDWLERIFLPITALLREQSVTEVLPGRTASELYVEIMVHKYYLSLREKRDVGVVVATRDFIHRFGTEPATPSFLQSFTERLLEILSVNERRTYFSSLG